jgi:peptidoglycan hydrolase-like protein with peptidoglycan-binding domain
MRYSDFKIVETAPTDANDPRGRDQRNDPNAPIEGGLKAGPPYPPTDTAAVKALQSKLQDLGYSVGSTGVDGKYGPRTVRAVAAYKKDNNIQGDSGVMSAADVTRMSSATPVADPTPTGRNAPGGELGTLSQDSVTQGKVGEILDLIASVESAGRYDAVYPGRRRPQILDMTIAELIQDMRGRGRRSGSSASGRYQYIRTTLQDVTSSMGIDINTTKFTPKVQDQIAIYHLRRSHGLDNWLAGRMSNEDFLNKIAGTWAGIPNTGGRSTHAGVLDNAAGTTTQIALAKLGTIQGTV